MPKERPQLQDRIDALVESKGVTLVERQRNDDDESVTFWATLPDGDKLSGKGATTEEALSALETKLSGWTS